MTEELEQRLREITPRASDVFRQTLRRQVLQADIPTGGRQGRRWQRWAAAAVVITLIGGLLLTPAGEALARLIIRIGPFDFTDDPTIVENVINSGEPVGGSESGEPVTLDTQHFATAAQASEAAGWTVLAPEDIPAGYVASSPEQPVEVIFNSSGEPTSAGVTYVTPDFADVLQITQQHLPDDIGPAPPLGMGDAEPTAVSVNGGDGLFMDGAIWGTQTDEAGEVQPVRYNVLTWEQRMDGDRFVFWIFSSERLPLDTLLTVAASMAR
jgi:hypothetical protein